MDARQSAARDRAGDVGTITNSPPFRQVGCGGCWEFKLENRVAEMSSDLPSSAPSAAAPPAPAKRYVFVSLSRLLDELRRVPTEVLEDSLFFFVRSNCAVQSNCQAGCSCRDFAKLCLRRRGLSPTGSTLPPTQPYVVVLVHAVVHSTGALASWPVCILVLARMPITPTPGFPRTCCDGVVSHW